MTINHVHKVPPRNWTAKRLKRALGRAAGRKYDAPMSTLVVDQRSANAPGPTRVKGHVYDASCACGTLVCSKRGPCAPAPNRRLSPRPSVDEVLPLVSALYDSGHYSGCCMHVQLEDGNIDDVFFDSEARERVVECGVRSHLDLFEKLVQMSTTQRAVVRYRSAWVNPDQTVDNCHPGDVEFVASMREPASAAPAGAAASHANPPRLKVGDRVRCVRTEHAGNMLLECKEYRVTALGNYGEIYVDCGFDFSWNADRFERLADAAAEWTLPATWIAGATLGQNTWTHESGAIVRHGADDMYWAAAAGSERECFPYSVEPTLAQACAAALGIVFERLLIDGSGREWVALRSDRPVGQRGIVVFYDHVLDIETCARLAVDRTS